MEVQAFLCNHAEVQGGLLYVSGGGIEISHVPAGSQPPYLMNFAIALNVLVPWNETNTPHKLAITLKDADGQPVLIGPDAEHSAPLNIEIPFNVGRPPVLSVGQSQNLQFACNMPNFPLNKVGEYVFEMSVDGEVRKTLSYRLNYANQ